jgi:hypothetical protein
MKYREILSRNVTAVCRYSLLIQQTHIFCVISHAMSIYTELDTILLKNISSLQNFVKFSYLHFALI